MNFVYPYRRRENDWLLLQSVRLVKELYPDARVVTVGDKVPGIDNIPCKDNHQIRGVNVTNKIMTASRCFNQFIYMNDDFLINDRFSFSQVYGGYEDLERKEGKASIAWNQAADNTKHFLEFNGYPIRTYECHQPVVFYSELLRHTFEMIDWKNTDHFLKSLYFNINPPKRVIEMENVKLLESNIGKAERILNIYGCLSVSPSFLDERGTNFIKSLSNKK